MFCSTPVVKRRLCHLQAKPCSWDMLRSFTFSLCFLLASDSLPSTLLGNYLNLGSPWNLRYWRDDSKNGRDWYADRLDLALLSWSGPSLLSLGFSIKFRFHIFIVTVKSDLCYIALSWFEL